MLRISFFVLFCGYLSSAFAIQEELVLKDMVSLLDSGRGSFYQIGFFETAKGIPELEADKGLRVTLGYTRFGQSQGPKGSVVLVPGRGEAALKYIEVAFDLIQLGYSPVYALDHRGQGLSDTFSRHPIAPQALGRLGHIEHFSDYVEDFSDFVNHVVLRDPSVDQSRLFLLSNSMGGAIAVQYFQAHPENPFSKAALSGSMFKIKSTEFAAGLKANFVCGHEWLASFVTRAECYGLTPNEFPVSLPESFALPKGLEIHGRAFHGEDPSFARNLTSSRARFRLNDYIGYLFPKTLVGGPTVRWAQQSLLATKNLRRRANVREIKTPLLILAASFDFRADEQAQRDLCGLLRDKCMFKLFEGYHELLMETDSVRNRVLGEIDSFFSQANPI